MSNPARKPCLGEAVHYVSYGTPGGEYPSRCRAADVTEVVSPTQVHLLVKNPTGLFFDHDNPYAPPDTLVGGTWHWESSCTHH